MKALLVASFFTLLLTACATTALPPPTLTSTPPTVSGGGTPGGGGGGGGGGSGAATPVPLVNITPFSALTAGFANQPSIALPDAYTRVVVSNTAIAQGGPGASELPYVQRNWFKRFFVGKHTSTNLTIKVSAGAFTATIPLVSIDHVSTKSDGESFTRIIYHQAENYPLFLVRRDGSNDVIAVRTTVKISDQVQSGAAGAALQVAQNVARTVAPQATVVTTLSAQSTKNVATAIDDAVNKLFAASVDEEQWTDNDVRFWGSGIQIDFYIPGTEGKLQSTPVKVGTWTLRFANPRPSVFSDIEVCSGDATTRCKADFKAAAQAAQAEVSPTDVLQFELTNSTGDLGTVSAYLKKQDWYTTALQAFSGTPTAADAVKFCQSIKSTISGIGLNSVDQGIVANAVVKGLPLPAAGVTQLTSGTGATACAFQYP